MSRIVAAALLSLIGAPALAADLPMKAPPAPPPILSWTGCYAGVHVGAGSIDNQIDGGPFVTTVPGFASIIKAATPAATGAAAEVPKKGSRPFPSAIGEAELGDETGPPSGATIAAPSAENGSA